ncbi:MAG: type II secretion system protein GspJ [Planctomycetota bacterium]
MKRTHGFTLLELIIAVAITALVMAMVGGILMSTLEADEKVSEALASEKVGYGVVSIIRRDLEACYSYALGAQAFKGERGTEGSIADRIAFVSAVEGDPDPQTGRRAKFQRIGYRLKQEPSSNVLAVYRYAEPYTSAKDDPLAAGSYAFIATGIKSLKFSYLDGKDKTWKDDEWKETDRVPIAVRIKVELAPAPGKQDQQSGFGLNAAATVESTVAIPTMLAPPPDSDPNKPPG